MDTFIEPYRSHISIAPESIRFSDSWYLFEVGTLVYMSYATVPQKVLRVSHRNGEVTIPMPPDTNGDYQGSITYFSIECYYLDYNGNAYIPVYKHFFINSFTGSQATTTVPVMPLDVALKQNLIDIDKILSRARQFTEITDVTHRYYSGRSQAFTPRGDSLASLNSTPKSLYSERIGSEVMVDVDRATQEMPWWSPTATPITPLPPV